MTSDGPVDVVVIGAGLAGLTAACRLTAAGASVVVVEARDRVGGRTFDHRLPTGAVVELGGQFVGPGQDRILDLVAEVGGSTFPVYDSGDRVLDTGTRRLRYARWVPRLPPATLLDAGQLQLRLARLSRRVRTDAPWETPRAERLDAVTVAGWLRRAARTRVGRDSLRLMVASLMATEADNVSLLHLLFFLRACGGFGSLTRTVGGAQQNRIVGGSQSVSVRLADRLGDRVRLRAPVRRIDWGPDTVAVHTDGGSVRGRFAVVAVPPTLAGRIDYRPALPAGRDQLTQRLPHGTVRKYLVCYDDPWWRADGLSGQGATLTGPVTCTYDNTPPDGAPGVLLVFAEGRDAQRLGALPTEEQHAAVTAGLVRMFGARAGGPVGWAECDWSAEEWTRGCYGAHFPPGVWTQFGPHLRAPIGSLHWAGTETATRWPTYMDGAVESGQRAAAEVLARL